MHREVQELSGEDKISRCIKGAVNDCYCHVIPLPHLNFHTRP